MIYLWIPPTWRFTNPRAGHPGKASKRGRMTVLRNRATGELSTVPIDEVGWHDSAAFEDAMATVWEDGQIRRKYALREIRALLGTA
jgi:nicotinamide phosphoribosyltransferase